MVYRYSANKRVHGIGCVVCSGKGISTPLANLLTIADISSPLFHLITNDHNQILIQNHSFMAPFTAFQEKKDAEKDRETSDRYHPMITTGKTVKTHDDHEINPPPILFNDDWSLMLRASNLRNLLLRDVVQNIEREQGKILSLQPIILGTSYPYRR